MNIFCERIYVKCEPDGLRFFLVWICSILDAKEGMRRYFMNGLKCEEIYLINAMVSVLILGGLSPFFVNMLDEFGLNFMGCFLVFGFCFHFLGFVVLVYEKSDFWNQFFVVLFCCFILLFYFMAVVMLAVAMILAVVLAISLHQTQRRNGITRIIFHIFRNNGWIDGIQ